MCRPIANIAGLPAVTFEKNDIASEQLNHLVQQTKAGCVANGQHTEATGFRLETTCLFCRFLM